VSPPFLESISFTAFRPDHREAFTSGFRDNYVLDQSFLTIQQLSNVKIFSGDMIMLSNQFAIYLMHKFPKLKSFALNREGQEHEDDEEDDQPRTLKNRWIKALVNRNFKWHVLFRKRYSSILTILNFLISMVYLSIVLRMLLNDFWMLHQNDGGFQSPILHCCTINYLTVC
jgi:hypothetical protein